MSETKSDILLAPDGQKVRTKGKPLCAFTVVIYETGAIEILEETEYGGQKFPQAIHSGTIAESIQALAIINMFQPLINQIAMRIRGEIPPLVIQALNKVMQDSMRVAAAAQAVEKRH
ncbi:hypothetical protein C4561_01830 [candidate division WWE3 bacterium]|uniref:Uncharacterized protein n=1 Tax=candidate division WWE3 bacterium TaxID=2053526 RepID=A0A3A4ZER8_UNCKA|nr:MAG: hypothetical protein C4561_01830 [candidate division WWE3 bacterium]